MDLVFVLRKMHTDFMPLCIMEMPICHEIDDTRDNYGGDMLFAIRYCNYSMLMMVQHKYEMTIF